MLPKIWLLMYQRFGYLIGLLAFEFWLLVLCTGEGKHVNAYHALNIFVCVCTYHIQRLRICK